MHDHRWQFILIITLAVILTVCLCLNCLTPADQPQNDACYKYGFLSHTHRPQVFVATKLLPDMPDMEESTCSDG